MIATCGSSPDRGADRCSQPYGRAPRRNPPGAAGAEDPAIENRVLRTAGERDVARVETDGSSKRALSQPGYATPSACDPPLSAASNSARPVELAAFPAMTLRARFASRCEYSSWRTSSATQVRTRIGADTESAPLREEVLPLEDTVTEVRLGDQT